MAADSSSALVEDLFREFASGKKAFDPETLAPTGPAKKPPQPRQPPPSSSSHRSSHKSNKSSVSSSHRSSHKHSKKSRRHRSSSSDEDEWKAEVEAKYRRQKSPQRAASPVFHRSDIVKDAMERLAKGFEDRIGEDAGPKAAEVAQRNLAATKLSEFLRNKGHEVPEALARMEAGEEDMDGEAEKETESQSPSAQAPAATAAKSNGNAATGLAKKKKLMKPLLPKKITMKSSILDGGPELIPRRKKLEVEKAGEEGEVDEGEDLVGKRREMQADSSEFQRKLKVGSIVGTGLEGRFTDNRPAGEEGELWESDADAPEDPPTEPESELEFPDPESDGELHDENPPKPRYTPPPEWGQPRPEPEPEQQEPKELPQEEEVPKDEAEAATVLEDIKSEGEDAEDEADDDEEGEGSEEGEAVDDDGEVNGKEDGEQSEEEEEEEEEKDVKPVKVKKSSRSSRSHKSSGREKRSSRKEKKRHRRRSDSSHSRSRSRHTKSSRSRKESSSGRHRRSRDDDSRERRHRHRRRSRSDSRSRRRSGRSGRKEAEKEKGEWAWGTGSSKRKKDRHRGLSGSPPVRSRSGSAASGDSEEGGRAKIDKKKLFEIARRNASKMLSVGTLQEIRKLTQSEISSLKAGGKSVDELVQYCKRIQRRERKEAKRKRREAGEKVDSSSTSSEEEQEKEKGSGDEDEIDFAISHPYELAKKAGIIMNLPKQQPIPVQMLSSAERAYRENQLRIEFPVSSGKIHTGDDPAPEEGDPAQEGDPLALPSSGEPLAILPPLPASVEVQMVNAELAKVPLPEDEAKPPVPYVPPKGGIATIVQKRLEAQKRLVANPADKAAEAELKECDEEMRKWTDAKNLPGSFIGSGSTGLAVLSRSELAPRDKNFACWTSADQLRTAKTLDSGVGLNLLRKMGWTPGEGLGKQANGALEPLTLDYKFDRRGLLAEEEEARFSKPVKSGAPMRGGPISLVGKNPVSVLMETCAKRRWDPPSFECTEMGRQYSKTYIWNVRVNSVNYQPDRSHGNKKLAKSQAAQVALQSLGLVARDPDLPVIVG